MGRKLIEVALPLDAINVASAREKSIRHGHPSTLHLWWARRPLAAARAVLFSSIVDDPGDPEYRWPAVLDVGPWDGLERIARGRKLTPAMLEAAATPRDHSEEEVDAERGRLHDLIATLVTWESTTDEHVLGQARAEIMRATDGNPPPVLDPFAGGGSIPLEAQRLGLEAHASDLNPVAVLINKALIEIPPKFADQPPVNPEARVGTGQGMSWKGATGLAADVRYYGKWMRDEAERRIGHLYPKVKLPAAQGGGEATVIAWLWARTITCPNPACGVQMPLVSSFWLSKKNGKEAHASPIVRHDRSGVDFIVRQGKPERDGTVSRQSASCVVCGQTMPLSHVRTEGSAGRMSKQLMAIVADDGRGRCYVTPSAFQVGAADVETDASIAASPIPRKALGINVHAYGMTQHRDLFTSRHLVTLATFSDLIGDVNARVLADARAAGLSKESNRLQYGGDGAVAYADAVATYLGICVSRTSNTLTSVAIWSPTRDQSKNAFSRQAIPITWDFAEVNPFAEAAGDFGKTSSSLAESLRILPSSGSVEVIQADARKLDHSKARLVSTDPPYYDNIGYADLSDFFYVWLRRSLSDTHPELFRTLLVPKAEELVATPFRFTGKRAEAEKFFEDGLQETFLRIAEIQDRAYPATIYYAFKQTETDDTANDQQRIASTGWETMLEGLVSSGFQITGTWPIRTERGSRMRDLGSNALASSIVLACRLRPDSASTTTRREFIRELRRELPGALKAMQAASIAPVDLAQAAIGPGMAIYSRYAGVLEPTSVRLPVRTALQLINQVLDDVLAEQDSEHDRDTGWAIAWFEQNGMIEAAYGQAETLATARNVSVSGLVEAGILRSGRGKVKLLARDELLADWDPATEKRLTDWEIAQYLIRELDAHGNMGAARLKRRIGGRADLAKDLAYRLYTICERKGWAQEAIAYNGLVVAWPEIVRLAADLTPADYQTTLTMGDS